MIVAGEAAELKVKSSECRMEVAPSLCGTVQALPLVLSVLCKQWDERHLSILQGNRADKQVKCLSVWYRGKTWSWVGRVLGYCKARVLT